jgi:hypothetical protein
MPSASAADRAAAIASSSSDTDTFVTPMGTIVPSVRTDGANHAEQSETGATIDQRVLKTEAPDERRLPDPSVRHRHRRIRSGWARNSVMPYDLGAFSKARRPWTSSRI